MNTEKGRESVRASCRKWWNENRAKKNTTNEGDAEGDPSGNEQTEEREASAEEPKDEEPKEMREIRQAANRANYQMRKARLEEMKKKLAEYEAKEKGMSHSDATTTASSNGGSDTEVSHIC